MPIDFLKVVVYYQQEMNVVKEKLRELGLSEKETKVYLALLGLGSSIVSDIDKNAGVNRSTAYIVLESLTGRGLVNVAGHGGKKTFTALPAEQLIRHLENTAKQYRDLAQAAHKLLPELKNIERQKKDRTETSPQSKSKIQLFEGQEGVKTVYEDTLASLEQIRAYASVPSASHVLKLSSKQRKAIGDVNVQVIFPNTREAREQLAQNKEEAREAFALRRGKSGFSAEINVYDNKVIFISPAENFGVIIESKGVADALKKALTSSRKEVGRVNKTAPAGAF